MLGGSKGKILLDAIKNYTPVSYRTVACSRGQLI